MRGQISVTDENDQLAYEAQGELALVSPTWQLFKDGNQLLTMRRRVWAWTPTWDIQGRLGHFTIRRKLFSWSRRYAVLGGPFSDVAISGNLWDQSFRIERASGLIATARGKVLSLRDRHFIEVIDTSESGEAFTVCAMVMIMLDRKADARAVAAT
jgi:uncharacterized protein YxjI